MTWERWWFIQFAKLVTPQNCTKMLRNLNNNGIKITAKTAGYKRWILLLLYNLHILASDQKKFFSFRALFEQLSLLKATFDCFLSSFWEITGNFLENLEQLVESPRYGSCDISLSSLGNCFYFYNFWISFYSRSLLKRKDISGQFRWVLSMNFIGKTNHTN